MLAGHDVIVHCHNDGAYKKLCQGGEAAFKESAEAEALRRRTAAVIVILCERRENVRLRRRGYGADRANPAVNYLETNFKIQNRVSHDERVRLPAAHEFS